MRIVTVVGINRYPAGFNSLTNAVADAQAIAGLLASDYGFTWWPADAPLLDEAATLAALWEAIRTALTSDADQWLFYFAGHGDVVGDAGYLIPADARPGEVATYLPLAKLLNDCRASAVDQIAIILDACYSGRALVRGALDDMSPSADHRRVRQIVSAGNPRQPVLDGGEVGHSVFAQSLLDALRGWAGIHEANGVVRFPRLLDHLALDVPGRLAGEGIHLQQPIGGHFQGNSEGRTFDFESSVPRLPPVLVRDLRSEDPARRRAGLQGLVPAVREEPAAVGQVVELSVRHLRPDASRVQSVAWAGRDVTLGQTPPLVGRTLRYEPAASVRVQAAATLGELGDGAVVDPLLLALDDEAAVCRAAATALGQLGARRAVEPLLGRLRDPARELVYLDLVAALGALGDQEGLLEMLRESRRRRRLVPFVGPDLPRALTGLPARAQVARSLAQEYGLPADESLARVAPQTMLGSSRHAFTAHMKRALDDQLLEPQQIYRALAALARLNVAFWLSAAYDGQLARALGTGATNDIATGSDTRHWRSNQPTVVRLLGNLAANRDVVVLEGDYERLREQEGERLLLLAFLREQLAGQVVLFLGHDPTSPDFALLCQHVLGRHLANVDVQAFLVWPAEGPAPTWGTRPIYPIRWEHLSFIEALIQTP